MFVIRGIEFIYEAIVTGWRSRVPDQQCLLRSRSSAARDRHWRRIVAMKGIAAIKGIFSDDIPTDH
jgi:hypothetical protein